MGQNKEESDMAHVLLNWTNLALFEAVTVASQRIDRKLPAGEWAELADAVITAGVDGDGVYTCQDATVPAKAELEALVEYRIVSVTRGGDVLGNVISVTIPALADPGVTNLTGEYVE